MKALFVSRHNNDYDSLAPVADGWVKAARGNRALFYFPNPEIRWRNDYRTAILRARDEIGFHDLWDVSFAGVAGKRLATLWSGVNANRRLRRKFCQLATEALVAPRFGDGLRQLLNREAPEVIVFDWYSPPPKRAFLSNFGYQEILAWARARKVPVISLPHGLVLYDRPQERGWDMSAYDAVFVESAERKATMLRHGGRLPEIFVCGSPRYDPSWVERATRQLGCGDDQAEPGDGSVRIVYFGKKQVYDFDFAEQNAWLSHLAAHDAVHLTIQPHPRGQRDDAFAELARLPNVSIDPGTPASALIGRTQIVSTLTSSVMVEAVIRGREILYPAFVNTVATRFAEKGACVSLSSMAETHPAIDSFLGGKRVPRANYDSFLEETVFGGGGPDTIARTVAKMAEIASRPE